MRPGTSLGYDVGPYQNDSSPVCAASRTWQPALTLSGSATIVSQQQLRLQHRTAAAYTTNYSALSHSFRDPGQSFRVPPAATSSSSPAAASQQRSSSNSSASSHTSNNNTTNSHHPPHSGAVASRFSPPLQNSHSQALPGRHLAAGGGAAHPLQAVQQHQQQQTYHPHPHSLVPHSRPSLPLSPNPSSHEAGPQYSQPFSQAVEYDVLRPPLVSE